MCQLKAQKIHKAIILDIWLDYLWVLSFRTIALCEAKVIALSVRTKRHI